MIDARVLSRMRAGSYLVNTARGAIVVVDDLLAALDSGILAGAGLDVLPVEPVPAESPLLGHAKVILTPHAAFFSVQSEIELRRKAAQNIVSWLATGQTRICGRSGHQGAGLAAANATDACRAAAR